MRRRDLEHIIRAAADIADDDEIVVVGSQAILGELPDAPAALLVSDEADVYPKNRPDRADLIDGCIGEGSPFHDAYGYYAQGVGPETAKLAPGWPSRLVRVSNPNTRGATGWCLEVHDVVLSKCVAGRDKDVRFLRDAVAHGVVRQDVLLARLESMQLDESLRHATRERILFAFRSVGP
ncbi:MAG: hypothetical protein MUF54_23200 [Polyangiaceae bacterium]|nr:hypothetical protein [Polyangiaceae bacterium]